MENKSHALAAGLFVIAVAALLLGLVSWLTSDKRAGDIYEMSTEDAVNGLSEQAAVRFRGITVGKVVKIGFDPQAREKVLVRIDIDKNLPLNAGTYASLGYQGVTGLAYVQLDNEGDATTPLVTDSNNPTRIPLRPGLLSQFADQGTFLLQQAQRISERVSALFSPENQQTVMGTVETIGHSAEKIGAASERIQGIMDAQLGPRETNIPALVNDTRATMQALQKTAAELQATAKAATQTAQSLAQTSAQISASGGLLDQLEKSAQGVRAGLVPNAARAADSLARTAESTNQAARDADRVFNNLGENPQSLIYGEPAPPPGPGEPGFAAPSTAR